MERSGLHVWAVIAGAVVALAVGFFIMALGSAIGITAARPSQALLTGLSIGFICWTLATMFTSGLLGAWVTGLLAHTLTVREGLLHGLLVWAVLVLTSATMLGYQLAGASFVIDVHRTAAANAGPPLGAVLGAWGVVIAMALALAGALTGGLLGARHELRITRVRREVEVTTGAPGASPPLGA